MAFTDRQKLGEEFAQFIRTSMKEPMMLDPTILVSKRHLDGIDPQRKDVYMPATISSMIAARDWESVDRVLVDLSWLFVRGPITEMRGVKRQLVRASEFAAPFGLDRTAESRLGELYPGLWDFEEPVDRVLAEEYSFLSSHSNVVARIRRPFYAFREKGLLLLDLGSRLHAAKKRAMAPLAGVKWFVGQLVAIEGLAENLPAELRFLRFFGTELLVMYDPAPTTAE